MLMRSYTISKAARLYGLSRSTLLYYDRVGLLSPSCRTSTGYRLYTEEDVKLLERICILRQIGLSIEDIKTIVRTEDRPCTNLFEKRLKEIGDEILALKAKQRLLSSMLKGITLKEGQPEIDKQMWIEMLQTAGMDEQGMERWHTEFEHRAPEAHHAFLLSLGIPEDEARLIRQWSRNVKPGESNVDP
jgi:DNA-binding transcriptional MerR regulator